MGNYNFEVQYQQSPIPAEGNMLKWWKSFDCYDELPNVVTTILLIIPQGLQHYSRIENFLSLIFFREKLLFPEMKRKIKDLHDRYRPNKLIIENKSSDISLIQKMR